jgi:hypothetical protein
MLGDHIEVVTEAAGSNRISLTLEGVGRRGELRETAPTGQTGTEIRITLKTAIAELSSNLPAIVRARAPMLAIPMVISVKDGESSSRTSIEPSWWRSTADDDLFEFVKKWPRIAKVGSEQSSHRERRYYPDSFESFDEYSVYRSVDFGGQFVVKGWPSKKPSYVTETERLVSAGGDPSYGIVRCSQGIAIDRIGVGDISGMVEVGPIELDVSRESVVSAERSVGTMLHRNLKTKIVSNLRPAVVEKVNEFASHGMVPGRIAFLRGLASIYGHQLLDQTDLPWIPLTEPPGNLIHRSRTELVSAVKQQRRLLIVIGANPGSAYSIAVPHVPPKELKSMLLIALSKEEMKVDYESKNKLEHDDVSNPLIGGLDDILERASCSTSELILTNFFIKCAAEAWTTSADELRSQDWRLDYKSNVLWSELKRP